VEKMAENKKHTEKSNYPLDQFPDQFDITKACSTTDCTGLIPSAIQDEAELDSYKDLYPFEPKAIRENKKEDIF
jgi:hypothetical protein